MTHDQFVEIAKEVVNNMFGVRSRGKAYTQIELATGSLMIALSEHMLFGDYEQLAKEVLGK